MIAILLAGVLGCMVPGTPAFAEPLSKSTYANLSIIEGFRGVPFGELEYKREELLLYDAGGPNTYYTRNKENMMFGAARLDGVAYIYNGGMFWSGGLFVYPSKIDTQVAVLHLQDLFGKEHFDEILDGQRTLTWYGRNVIIVCEFSEGDDGSNIYFYDLKRIKDNIDNPAQPTHPVGALGTNL